jgi:mono/diheme cytochrome c family protein
MQHITLSNLGSQLAHLIGASLVATLLLTGCGGGKKTEQNPVTNGPTAGPSYNGPPPATADVQSFKINLYDKLRTKNCTSCHDAGGQSPTLVRSDDVNLAYQQTLTVVDLMQPAQSRLVSKVGGGHNCWVADPQVCADTLIGWISDWAQTTQSGGGRTITLVAPPDKSPGASKRFPAATPTQFAGVHALLTTYCAACHVPNSAVAQSPFFAQADIDLAYAAAKTKINLDDPSKSRLVVRLSPEFHNCWSDCAANASTMQNAIQALSDAIPVSQVDPTLVLSKALSLADGTLASGGNRYDVNVIAQYEFKTGQGLVAFDTSGVEPAMHLGFSGDVTWVGGYGINIRSGKVQASTASSKKLHNLITATGEYSIEAWVVPGNTTQENARIVTYSGSATSRNFTMSQTKNSYELLGRSSTTGANGTPAVATVDADRKLQSSLQHVVMTFDPIIGRRIYVNGVDTGAVDSGGGSLAEWDDSFAFALGNEVSNNRQFTGVLRFVAIHNRVLTPAQVQQNFEAGVGQKFFLLFGVSHLVDVPQSYILFEVTQNDSFSYLFTNPKFISLDPNARPGSIALKGMRIGVNGTEPIVGQAYKPLDTVIQDSLYSNIGGQSLSTVGTIIGLEDGPMSDEFFLCFDQLGSRSKVCSTEVVPVAPTATDIPKLSDIGVRTFEKLSAAMSAVTGVPSSNPAVKATYGTIFQALPPSSDITAFLASQQTAIAQLSIQYCSSLVDDTTARAAYFPGFNFSSSLSTTGDRDLVINPILARVFGTGLATQPTLASGAGTSHDELDALMVKLCTSSACGGARTATVIKATCAAAVGSAVLLVN